MFPTKKRVLIPLAPGFEELEAVASIDLLRRAGAHVVTVSVDAPNPIVGQNRIRVMADLDITEALAEWGDDWDLLLLPGGGAVGKLAENASLMGLIERRLSADAPVAAICAAPKLLAASGLPRDTPITNYPGCADDLSDFSDYREDAVVRKGNVLTSRGPATAYTFGLACVELLYGADKRAEIAAETVGS